MEGGMGLIDRFAIAMAGIQKECRGASTMLAKV
jgi:hypothetical protein